MSGISWTKKLLQDVHWHLWAAPIRFGCELGELDVGDAHWSTLRVR